MAEVSSRILIIDYGSQFTQLIARRVREARVYSEIHPPTRSLAWIRDWKPTGIILSGGPNSVYDDGAPGLEAGVLDVAPVLAICYGMQLVAQSAGAEVKGAGRREYGRAELEVEEADGLFAGFAPHEQTTVWMSHGDHVDSPPPGYVVTASSRSVPVAAIRHRSRPVHGVQFHPEVAHTARGAEVISNFLFRVCKAEPSWTPGAFVETEIRKIRDRVGDARVI